MCSASHEDEMKVRRGGEGEGEGEGERERQGEGEGEGEGTVGGRERSVQILNELIFI